MIIIITTQSLPMTNKLIAVLITDLWGLGSNPGRPIDFSNEDDSFSISPN